MPATTPARTFSLHALTATSFPSALPPLPPLPPLPSLPRAMPSSSSKLSAAPSSSLSGPAPLDCAFLEFNERNKHFNAWVASTKVKKETDHPAVPAEEKPEVPAAVTEEMPEVPADPTDEEKINKLGTDILMEHGLEREKAMTFKPSFVLVPHVCKECVHRIPTGALYPSCLPPASLASASLAH